MLSGNDWFCAPVFDPLQSLIDNNLKETWKMRANDENLSGPMVRINPKLDAMIYPLPKINLIASFSAQAWQRLFG